MKHFLLLLFTFFCTVTLAQETERRFVYFGYNDTTLSANGKADIDTMISLAGHRRINQVEVYAYTDNRGDETKNMLLAQQRANVVRRYLIASGVSASVIVVEAFGEQNPAFSNETEKGQRKNRRAEVVFTYSTITSNNDDDDVVLRTPLESEPIITHPAKAGVLPCAADTQHFTFHGDKEITLTGKQGTVLHFYKNSFLDKDGKVIKDEIQFELIEVYQKSDMVRFQLSTVSNGKLLESGGMVYINALYNGQPATLNSNVWEYEISFPTNDKKSDMSIFYADSVSGPSDWDKAERNFWSDNTYIQNQDSLNKYIFNGNQMGWINCDHFWDSKKPRTDVYADAADTAGVLFMIVFKDINSAMTTITGNGPVKFNQVPLGYEITVVAFRKNANSYSYFSKDITVERNHHVTVVMEELTEEEFQKRNEELN